MWRAYREKYGSFFFGRRIEQGFGNWMAHYSRFKAKNPENVNALDYMPHEQSKQSNEISFEDYLDSLCDE